jgi:hypothetical protein
MALGVEPQAWAAQPEDPHAWKLGPSRKCWCLTTTLDKSRAIQQGELWSRIPRAFWGSRWNPASGFYNSLGALSNGTLIKFKSREQGLRELESDTIDIAWVDETLELPYITALLVRLVARGGCLIWTTIPDSSDLYELFVERRIEPGSAKLLREGDVAYIGGVMRDNPHLSEREIEMLEAMLPAAEREMRVFGKFMPREGLVYAEYAEELHLEQREPPLPEDWWANRYEAIDPGWGNPCAVLFGAVDRLGVRHCYDEVYGSRMTLGQLAAQIYLRRWQWRGLMTPRETLEYQHLVADALRGGEATTEDQMTAYRKLREIMQAWRAEKGDLRPRRLLVDEYAKQSDQAKPVALIQQLAEFGLHAEPVSNRDKAGQERRVHELLRPLDGLVRIKVNAQCTWARYELAHHRYAPPDDRTQQYLGDRERRVDAHNHWISCLEYWCSEPAPYVPLEAQAAPSGSVLARHREAVALATGGEPRGRKRG